MTRSVGQGRGVFDRVPPQNVEAERAVLGAVLLNPEVFGEVMELLGGVPSEVFYVEAHQHVYGAMLGLERRHVPVDSVTLMEQLEREGLLEAAGGVAYIAGLAGAVPTSANVGYYAGIVGEAALLRRLISTCSRIAGGAYAPAVPASEVLNAAEAAIFALGQGRGGSTVHGMGGVSLRAGMEMIAAAEGKVKGFGVMTGLRDLDRLLCGLQPGDLVVLGARPSVGKTALALNISLAAAVGAKKRVLFFSLEMSKESLAQRCLCSIGGVDGGRLRAGFLSRGEVPKIREAMAVLQEADFRVDDTAGLNVMEFRSRARRAMAAGGLDLIVVDYLQLMSGSGRNHETRQTEVSEISRVVKQVAKELGVPVLALSQLSRESEKGDEGRPKLSHLRESGAIEQDADVVLLLARAPKSEQEGVGHGALLVDVLVEKQRNGPTGSARVVFRKDVQQFVDYGRASEPAAVGGGRQERSTGYDRAAGGQKEEEWLPVEDRYEEDDEPF